MKIIFIARCLIATLSILWFIFGCSLPAVAVTQIAQPGSKVVRPSFNELKEDKERTENYSTDYNSTTKNDNDMSEEETQELLAENQDLKYKNACISCREKEVDTAFTPCGHMLYCDECSKRPSIVKEGDKCYTCFLVIKRILRVKQ